MKKIFGTLALCATVCMLATSCDKKKEAPAPAPEPVVEEVYQPQHTSVTVDLKTIKKYNYTAAPEGQAATSVVVNYDQKKPYAQPVEIKFSYANGDTRTYVIPADFGLWKNQAGRFRVVSDNSCTVWLQGQTKKGKFCEFVFYGDPQYNGTKIKPNSYRNLPAGEIKYRK